MIVQTAQEIGEAQEVLKQHLFMVDADLDLEAIMLRCMGDAVHEKHPFLRCEKLIEMCAAAVEIIEQSRSKAAHGG